MVSFPALIPPRGSPLPVALSVFIDLGKTGGRLEGHDTSRTTHSQQSTERHWKDSPRASWFLEGVWQRQGREVCGRAPPAPTPAPHTTPTGLKLSRRGAPGWEGEVGGTERVHWKGIWGSVRSAWGGEEERSTGKGTVRRHPWPALCPLLPAQALSRGTHWVLALGPSRTLTVPASGMACPPPLSPSTSWGPRLLPCLCSLPSACYSVRSTLQSSWPRGACHPVSSARSQLPAGAGLTPTHLGVTTWGAGQCGGPGGCGSSPSVPRPPHPLGSALACECGAGRRWH